ncbi:hypothetical protein M6B38_224130 [Iris pallida]|uniref:Uncharacterized protein n=1 Tax=Iris pallida TaxID=29817 RepID=A0AAX6DW28_IRIPA|nr:hypothetical protein M6B38_224130 [Iris pallida]
MMWWRRCCFGKTEINHGSRRLLGHEVDGGGGDPELMEACCGGIQVLEDARRCSFVRNKPRTTVFRWWVSRDGVGRRKETKIEALTQVRIKVVVAWDGVNQQVASLPQRTRHGGGRRQDWAANTRSDGSRPEEDSDGGKGSPLAELSRSTEKTIRIWPMRLLLSAEEREILGCARVRIEGRGS